MPQWSKKETELIAVVRSRCAEKLATSPPFPEVVGDRKIVRFLRGHDHNIEKVVEMVNKFLDWRRNNGVDEVRTNIVERGMDHPLRFPKGELIMSLIPQLILAPDAQDFRGSPVSMAKYDFDPATVMAQVQAEEFMLFVIYILEYRSIITEQLSKEREKQYLARLSPAQLLEEQDPEGSTAPYGQVVGVVLIRDMAALGLSHLGKQGMDLMRTIINVASDNYPELMARMFIINVPMIFNTIWWMVRGWVNAHTLQKVNILGSNYMTELVKEFPTESIPAMVGGTYHGYEEYTAFAFDIDYLCNASKSTASTATDASDAVHGSIAAPII